MAIEFRCPNCQQLLRVPEESAGKNAKCPKCATVATVPAASAATPQQPPWSQPGAGAGGGGGGSPFPPPPGVGPFPAPGANPFAPVKPASPSTNPYASPAAAYSPAIAAPGLPLGHQVVGVEPILNYAWQVWQANLGLLVGITFVAGLISAPFEIGTNVIEGALRQNGEEELAIAASVAGGILGQIVQLFLSIGETQIALKLARGQRAEFSELFGGGPLFLPVLGAWLLATIATIVGFAACIIPGFVLLVMFWPYFWLVVDNKTPVLDSFGAAYQITEGNRGTTILLALLSLGIILLGCVAFCIGLLFAAPLVALMWSTAYLMMSGQLPVQPMYSQYGQYSPQPMPGKY